MTESDFVKLLEELGTAWVGRDYAKAASFFASDVEYSDPLRYTIKGRAALFDFFTDDGGHEQTVQWHNVIFDESRQLAACEYSYTGTHIYHGLVMVKLKDGLITNWREYQHTAEQGWEDFWGDNRF